MYLRTFKKWVNENAVKIEKANRRGTLPYFLKNNANFVRISVDNINIVSRKELLKEAKKIYNSYNSEDWKKTYFDQFSGGYVVTHKGHKFDIETGKYEIKTANILAKYGYRVEMMDESNFKKPQYDINVNGFPTEIKVMSGYRNIHTRAEKASLQRAKRIVYYIKFDNEKEMFKRFDNVYKTVENINEIWYIKNDKLHILNKKK